jgi:GT2 family glycosyltransferase
MVRHLRNDQTLCLVGPVTNAIGNEAAIEISYSSEKQMLAASSLYTASHFRRTFLVEKVAFFLVGFTKHTWDAIGELDESYGLGYFEDDDYCMRVRAADLKIAVAEDTFVHHQLSASFDAIGAARKKAQFDASRAVFEKKWGPWETHQYRRQRGPGGSPQSRL